MASSPSVGARVATIKAQLSYIFGKLCNSEFVTEDEILCIYKQETKEDLQENLKALGMSLSEFMQANFFDEFSPNDGPNQRSYINRKLNPGQILENKSATATVSNDNIQLPENKVKSSPPLFKPQRFDLSQMNDYGDVEQRMPCPPGFTRQPPTPVVSSPCIFGAESSDDDDFLTIPRNAPSSKWDGLGARRRHLELNKLFVKTEETNDVNTKVEQEFLPGNEVIHETQTAKSVHIPAEKPTSHDDNTTTNDSKTALVGSSVKVVVQSPDLPAFIVEGSNEKYTFGSELESTEGSSTPNNVDNEAFLQKNLDSILLGRLIRVGQQIFESTKKPNFKRRNGFKGYRYKA